MRNKVSFNYANATLNISGKKELKRFIESLFEKENIALGTLSYVFCSDEDLLEMNKKFLNHDYYTDILTFDLSDNASIKGEVYISVERVKENAFIHSKTYFEEVLRVIFHGALHLCGYGDKSKEEKLKMRAREDYYIHAFQNSIVKVSRETKEEK